MKQIKEIVQLVITHFFIITVGVLFITSVSNLIEGTAVISADYQWKIMFTGFTTALPSVMFYFKNEPTNRQFIVRCAIHFVLIEAIVLSEGALFGWYGNFTGALVISLMILFVYVLVWVYTCFVNRNTANDINDALNRINGDGSED